MPVFGPDLRQASRIGRERFIHIFEERCIAVSFRFRFVRDGRFIAALTETLASPESEDIT